jgi:hypothetical protein
MEGGFSLFLSNRQPVIMLLPFEMHKALQFQLIMKCRRLAITVLCFSSLMCLSLS